MSPDVSLSVVDVSREKPVFGVVVGAGAAVVVAHHGRVEAGAQLAAARATPTGPACQSRWPAAIWGT